MTEAEFDVRGRRSFLTGLAAAAAGGFGWYSILNDEPVGRIPGVLRSAHERNGSIWQSLYSSDRLAPTYDPSEARALPINGRHGVRDEMDLDAWSMEIVGRANSTIAMNTMDDVLALPFEEMTVEHKCVEGWSEVVTWGGTPFSNLAEVYSSDAQAPFVNLETPDGDYYVSLDRDSMLHSQTFLAWELNGDALTQLHGAPLRLVTPLKYGIKQIKRIGRIEFSDTRAPTIGLNAATTGTPGSKSLATDGVSLSVMIFGVPILRVIIAIAIAYAIIRLGLMMLRGMAAPIPQPPPAGELRRVKLQYQCEMCGTEVRMTLSTDQAPEAPRHCMQEMELVTPVE
ncbi:MAG: DMSO/TMAO reductase YedYZ molybdopterin-dependent catalytic subunit [Verrucomicrobiales bacterium]|jgi:DMSO/TMAO reductase YedYZ molybdopterin-dependent catalytic subunit